AVPHELRARTVAVVFEFLTGGAATARSAPVVLANGVATTMLARKVMTLMAAVSAGLIGVGVLLADARGTPPTPSPAPAPAAAAPAGRAAAPTAPKRDDFDWAREEAQTRARIAEAGRGVGREPSILIEGLCCRVSAGFVERSGLADESAGWLWELSRRETRMLVALFRSEPKWQVTTRPQFLVADGQTGFAQIGQEVPVPAAVTAGAGIRVKQAAVDYRPVGVTLRVTPKIQADTGKVMLRIETQSSALADPAGVGGPLAKASVNVSTLQTTALIPDTGTVVVRDALTKVAGEEAVEQLWLLTVHIVRGGDRLPATPEGISEPAPMPPGPPPTPSAPPATPSTRP
ncbi:MAG TPA: hypothetical protein VH092_38060, partial [Urbifossiella sp.]|nr:hypothetical protein [Urbifossiella sp.]